MGQSHRRRQAITLLELLVVVTLVGIFASAVAIRFGRTLFAEFGSQGEARQLSLALLACQRAAISTGDDHYVEFLSSGGKITSFRIMRDIGGVATLVDGPKSLSNDVTVTVSNSTMRYNFEGSALSNYWIDIVGQARTWRVDVIPINGTIRVTQTS